MYVKKEKKFITCPICKKIIVQKSRPQKMCLTCRMKVDKERSLQKYHERKKLQQKDES